MMARPISRAAGFVAPTVFANVDNRARISQEEIFGPEGLAAYQTLKSIYRVGPSN
jgi:acyl-CoA reductase-like NAD-dependent aldehyde dehydrogenase